MGKSSSSLKRKRAKKSPSKGYNKSKSGRRSRKYKSKKILRRADSFSSPDEDYSRSSISVSASSDDDSYRMRKSRSRTRKRVKGSKRARRHSCSTESSEESARDRKRKRSKRKDVNSDVKKKKKKKTYKTKKPRKEASVSSKSSESKSCSTQSGSESSDIKYESHKSRLDRRENDGINSEGYRNEINRYRSRSSPSCSGNNSHDLSNEFKYKVEKNSRQLKSVITIPHDIELDGKSPLDEMQNEEHGCTYFRSSSGCLLGSSTRESDCMEIECQKEAQVEIEKGDANAYNGNTFVGHKKDDKINRENTIVEDQYVGKKTSEVSAAVGSFQSDDLESLLRERALENLRKFRQELQTNGKSSDQKKEINNVAKQNQVEKEEQSKTMPTVGNDVVVGRKSAKESFVEGQCSAPSVSRDDLSSSSNTERTHQVDLGSHKSDPARHELTEVEEHSISKLVQDKNMPVPHRQASKVGPLIKRDIVSNGSKNIVAQVNSSNSLVPKLSSSVVSLSHHHQDELYKDKVVSQETRPQEVSRSTKLEEEFGLDVNASSEQTVAQGISNVEKDLHGDSPTLRSSSCKPSSNEYSSNKLQASASDCSQFEQKTMQVMRGGEMVQVSYKVYIPKKAPALSRRQIKR